MNEIKIKLLAMLKEFHKICISNDIRYYVIGGTALGAMRHQGFIPWDDDIDVGLPRPDYEKLKKLVSEKTFGKYIFEYSQKKDFVYPFGKMYDSTTTLIENTRYKTKRGIYIDIFPLDGIGETKEEALRNFMKIDTSVNMLMTLVCGIRKGRALYKNFAIRLMRCVPTFIINKDKLVEKISKKSQRLSYEESTYVANLVGNWHEREIVKKEWFGNPTECDFEGITVMKPEKTDDFLTAIYGDWRQLPPKEKQISHHDYLLLDLHKGYIDDKSNTEV